MNITRKSAITGKIRTRNISVKPEDLALYESGVISISDAMPYLNSSDREFILCGITRNEWKDAFSKELQAIVNDRIV
jgi:hypothetical protein